VSPDQPAAPAIAAAPPEERLAERLAAEAPAGTRTAAITTLTDLARLDRAVYRAVAGSPTPTLDRPLRRLSQAANRSTLWIAVAGALAAVGGRAGRRAAGAGLVAVAVDSAVVNAGLKLAARRRRPDRDSAAVPAGRHVPMPTSRSFPSGHTASGFAFANAVGQTMPAVAAPLRLLAAVVGYSRVHTGVHYPGDVVLGALVGASVGELVGWGAQRVGRPRANCCQGACVRSGLA
jgi:membrane-associated phospholipid phosphatase